MQVKSKSLGLVLLLLICMLVPSYRASATASVVTGFVSERKTTIITLDHEDASPMSRLVSYLSQNVDAIDNVFNRLHYRGVLKTEHSTLVIATSGDAYQGLLPAQAPLGHAVLSLQDNYRLDLDPHDIAEDLGLVGSINLGPVYLVEVLLWPVTINDLLAMVFLLPELSSENPRLELTAAEIREHRDRGKRFEIERLAEEWSSNDVQWSPDGSLLLAGAWHNRRLQYELYNFTTRRRTLLDPIHLSIMPPTFSPDSRYIVSASNHELRIMDVRRQQTWRLSFAEMIPEQFELISTAQFAVNNRGDALFFALFGYGMESSLNLVWRSREPKILERMTELQHMEKPALPGETWSDFLVRRHPAIITTVQEFASLAAELAKEQEYGEVYDSVANSPKDSHLALLVGEQGRLVAQVLTSPLLEQVDLNAFALVPEHSQPVPGTLARVSLFNVGVAALITLMSLGIAKLIGVAEQRAAKRTGLLAALRRRRLTFVSALLVTLMLHFIASLATFMVVHDRMGESARRIAEGAIAESYGAGLDYSVQFSGGSISIAGSSLLIFFDFPYQVLYWHVKGRESFIAPILIRKSYYLFDQLGHLVSIEDERFYVLGVDHVVQK